MTPAREFHRTFCRTFLIVSARRTRKRAANTAAWDLGLAIVRHLVEMHGGTVRANSEGEGKGATFTVMLPITPVYQVDSSGGPGTPGARDLIAA